LARNLILAVVQSLLLLLAETGVGGEWEKNGPPI
jgi:hypothetical protein